MSESSVRRLARDEGIISAFHPEQQPTRYLPSPHGNIPQERSSLSNELARGIRRN